MGSLGSENAKRAMWIYPKVSGSNPTERWGHSACSSNGIVFIFGGCCGGLHFSDVLALNLETMVWNTLVTAGDGPGPRDSHGAVLMGQKMIVFGGTDGYRKVNSLHILDLWTKEWSRPEYLGTPPSPRESHTATLVGGDKIVVFGGSGEGEGNYLNDLHVLDLKTMRWTSPEVRGDIPVPRDSHSAVALGNKLFVYGGDCGDRYNGDVDMLDMETLTWSKLAVQGSSPGARAGHASVNIGTKIFVIGGVGDSRYYNDVWTLNVNTCSWTRLIMYGQQPKGRFSHTATVMGSYIAIYGGCGEDERPLNELMVLQLGGEYLKGDYNSPMYSILSNHKINEKEKTLVGGDQTLPNIFRGDSRESKFAKVQHVQSFSGTFHPKRRRTSNTKGWEIESEQEEHSLSLSQHSSPSQSDQEQTLVRSTADHDKGSKNFHFFKQANQLSSNCHPRPTSNHRELRNNFRNYAQDRTDHQQPRQEQYSHVHIGGGGMQLLRREQENIETRSFHNLIGAEVQGKIDGAFDSGFLLTASVNGKLFRGVLFSRGPAVSSIDCNLARNTFSSFRQTPTGMELSKSSQQPVAFSMPESRRSLRQPEVIRPRTAARASSSSSVEPKFKSDLQGVVLTLASPGSNNNS